ncbi:hypothetical protein FDUTEX481_01343 [Tolypothrix sp. PCC 7601]|nr:hypothetical protein FDUTEX481_01343 [Tolypothrix sp. PCC 7601]
MGSEFCSGIQLLCLWVKTLQLAEVKQALNVTFMAINNKMQIL